MPTGNTPSIVNLPRSAHSAYPLSTFSYVDVPASSRVKPLLIGFIKYALTAGQSYDTRLDFASIPSAFGK